MYAVIRIGKHQYNVTPGRTIRIEKLDAPVGSEVEFKDLVLLADGDQLAVGKTVKGTVYGIIKTQGRGDKIRVYKKKRRTGFSKTIGHRQPYTQVEITKIEG